MGATTELPETKARARSNFEKRAANSLQQLAVAVARARARGNWEKSKRAPVNGIQRPERCRAYKHTQTSCGAHLITKQLSSIVSADAFRPTQ